VKRFYKEVSIGAKDGGWQVILDHSRPMRTQAGSPQIVPTQALAEALAEEWRAQGEEIDPAGFPMRDMADYAIDRVAPDPASVVAAIVPYGDTDTLCYRAEQGDSLRQRQDEAWEPILCAAEERHGIVFARTSGVIHAPQSAETLAALQVHLASFDPFTLVAVQNLAALAGSLTVALAALEDGTDIERLFADANLEEDWQAKLWGWDNEALARRDARLAGFRLAAQFARLVRAG